jgi:membrane-bound lytic murein transglycosylase B
MILFPSVPDLPDRHKIARLAGALVVACGLAVTAAQAQAPAAPAAKADKPAAPETDARFAAWLKGVYDEALSLGIHRKTLDAALTGLAPIKRVVQLDRRQPEFTQTFRQYIDARVSAWRVRTGRDRLRENRKLLDEIGAKFGVQPRFIVALWGIETSFGRATGGFSVIRALATLAYDGRRSAYFRRELFNALRIIDAGHVTAGHMLGSWAGAMGQNQFMPSSFLSYAVDYDGDGRRDIWTTRADVFASSANFLKRSGWREDQTWGREVRLPKGFADKLPGLMPAERPKGCRALAKISVQKTLPEWAALGIRRADGGPLPPRPLKASLVVPEGAEGPALLVYGNFRATLKWNCSVLFATAVGILADRLRGL